jgi:hypothetical protein
LLDRLRHLARGREGRGRIKCFVRENIATQGTIFWKILYKQKFTKLTGSVQNYYGGADTAG